MEGFDPAKRIKRKRFRRMDLNTNLLQVVGQMQPLSGLLLDTAVWVCCDDTAVHQLDTLCLGNLDGGPGTAQYVRQQLEAAGREVVGDKAVRLSLDEAFFMAYVLRVLTVLEAPQQQQLQQQQQQQPGGSNDSSSGAAVLEDEVLWQRLQQLRPDFLLLYLAYHHFRSKGWIPRTGLQYGGDYVLYQRHPAIAHSDFTVVVMPLTPGLRPPMSWHDIQVSNRLSTQVSKRLLLLYVQELGGSSDYSSPKCLCRFAVHERMVRRWVPESQRLG